MREFSESIRHEDQPVYSIGTVARMLGVSVFTLRMYEREGLLISFKAESNQRRYSESDIERLKCIRKAINEEKFSIPAIRAIYSMIPCWEIVRCTEVDRAGCPAYKGHSQPCWTYEHKNSACGNQACRECPVYRHITDCGKIKASITNIPRTA